MNRSLLCIACAACSWILLSAAGCGGNHKASESQAPRSGVPAVGLSAVELVRRMEPSLVRVQVRFAPEAVSGDPQSQAGFGTGIIFDRQGHIVTSDHVLLAQGGRRLAERIVVTVADGRSFWAVIAGRDRATDIAVLKIEAEGLVPASFARSGDLRIGQEILALGYALDLRGGPTVTRGIVSATRQSIHREPYTIPEIIQTDAGINPGNSGGPLINASGEVVGINTAIVKEPGSPGFAISMALAKPVIQALIKDGRIHRSFLGVGTIELTPAVAARMGLKIDEGIVVTLIAADSPAQRAGVRENDVILTIGGRTIRSNGDLLAALASHAPSETVLLNLHRESKPLTLTVVLGHPPE